ncbi:EamA family transporter [Mucilaginibacter hurinus]|uniref:EamA family transporter n=1 Tax=Mucilaginibacter hurinus TaxID=2201324 RepID=A0A367GNQ0_9SPHI|nr:EamA family transporter [Mucilaginibacter hurinus]RCH55107.1 EamA family transporter [Mucilaginibacter hurinus]
MTTPTKTTSTLWVIVAFAVIYVVWGSTYFFIQMAIHGIPPFVMGAIRFLLAGMLMLAWCVFTGEKLGTLKKNKHVFISGVMMLFGGNGALIWAEQSVPSGLAAILVSAGPIWFVLLDKSHWHINFKSKSIMSGLVIGFGGVVLLFSEQLSGALNTHSFAQLPELCVLIFGSIMWASGSLYAKHKAHGTNATVNATLQMLAAGIAFIPGILINNELKGFSVSTVPASAWWAVAYLVTFGSIIGFSAYVWLLKVRSAAQVSTHSYVNPVIAVILGVAFAGEQISIKQVIGLVIILCSVLLINMATYRKAKRRKAATI